MKTIFIFLITLFAFTVFAEGAKKKVTYRKTQSVDFEGDNVDGSVRNPDGAYMVQKRGVDFVPLYKVKERFDDGIKSSIDYLK